MTSPRPALARLSLSVLALVAVALIAPPVDRQVAPWSITLAFALASIAWDGWRATVAVIRTIPGDA